MNRKRIGFFIALALTLAWCGLQSTWRRLVAQETSAPASAQDQAAAGTDADGKQTAAIDPERLYIRVEENDDGDPLALQTATVRYVGRPGTPHAGDIVDLVGVVHVGQDEYYADLNDQLATYDKVLYELVAPDGTRIRPADLEKRRSLLSSVQSGMKDLLNLEYQLEKVDYLAKNFRHADMSPDEFAQDLARRGDSVWKMVARMMGAGLVSQAQTGGNVGLMTALLSDNRSMMLKRVMARQLIDIETVTAGIDDAQGENTLIKGRNRKAMRILEEVLSDGADKVAVFYGAGHLPDMAQRLEDDFQMKADKTTWSDAWDLTRN